MCKRTVEHLDVYPTLAELCELKGVPATIQGTSIASLVRDGSAAWDKPAVSQVARPPVAKFSEMGYSIRTERYRYTSWQGNSVGEELYDYQSDPDELKNLATSEGASAIKDKLKLQLAGITAARGRRIELGTKVEVPDHAARS